MQRVLFIMAAAATLVSSGCEEPAATTKLVVQIQGVGPRDVQKGQLQALVQLGGSCTLGPCDPNPCTEEEGKTRCLAQGTVFRCDCAPGTSLDAESLCVIDEGCTATFCAGNGQCMEDDQGVPACECSTGYLGNNCQDCDEANGFFSDGFGSCTDELEVCRAEQGFEGFSAFLAEAEEKLGHPANEIELTSASMKIVEGSTSAVRSWPYLWNGDIELLLQPTDGNTLVAGTTAAPSQSVGLVPLSFDVTVDRPAFTREAKYFEGDFLFGVSGSTARVGNEPFEADVELTLEFNAY